MRAATRIQLDPYLEEAVAFFQPAVDGLQDEVALASFLASFGYDLDTSQAAAAIDDIRSSSQLTTKFAALTGSESAATVAIMLFASVEAFARHSRIQSIVHDTEAFSLEIFDHLCHHYLSTRIPLAAAVLKALGVMTSREIKTTDPGGRDLDYTRIEFKWEVLGDFVGDNGKWAKDLYGWGQNFDYNKAINNLILVIQASHLALARKRTMTAAEAAVFLKNSGGRKIAEAAIPFIQNTLQRLEGDGTPLFSNEAGLKVVPFGDVGVPAKLGLALAPFTVGRATGHHALSSQVAVDVTAGTRATGGAYVTMTPDGIQVTKGVAVDAAFEFGLTYANEDGSPIVLVGDAFKSRLQTKSMLASAGGNLTGDIYIAAGFQELAAVVDFSDDGFLGALVSKPIEIEAGTIMMGWRPGRGVYFDGGTSITVTIPLDLDAGAISIHELIIALDWAKDLSATVALTADATLGPVYLAVENAGVVLTVVPSPSGNGVIGKYDLVFGFKAPTGYAVALEADPIEGGGYLSVGAGEYRGALALKLETISFSAFAVLATQLPGGANGFSMAASIFGEFNVPLGWGFFLTGVGGVIGINCTVDSDALRDVLYEGRLDNILFPNDPIENAATILADMAAILPARQGQYLFGPVGRIGWGQPTLIQVTLGVVLEIGGDIRILVLGGLGCALPTEDAALVVLSMSFFGEIDFAAGTIEFDASLQGSRVLSWPISGDTAIRTGWAQGIQHIASFGGLHPRYPRPANLPDLRRMSINFGTNNPKITLSAYQAVTMNSLQFGARADLYAKGPKIVFFGQVAAEGNAYFDALIYFNPFSFDVLLGGGLSLLVDGDVVCGLGFRLRLTGPNTITIDGKVWVTVCRIDIDFAIKHTWGQRQSLPNATVDAVAALRTAINGAKTFEPISPRGRSSGVTFRNAPDVDTAIDPIGGMRFVERAVPLGIRIEKIGEASVSGPATLDLKVTSSGRDIEAGAADLEFVRGHFFELSEAERLRAPAFESHKAGFEFAPDDLAVRVADAVTAEYEYEVIEIPVVDDRRKPVSVLPHKPLAVSFSTRFMNATHNAYMRPQESLVSLFTPARPVTVSNPAFVRQDVVAAMKADFVTQPTLSAAKSAVVNAPAEANIAVADYVAAARFKR